MKSNVVLCLKFLAGNCEHEEECKFVHDAECSGSKMHKLTMEAYILFLKRRELKLEKAIQSAMKMYTKGLLTQESD
jgi:hypothetical protein